jgi:hypothetical protein
MEKRSTPRERRLILTTIRLMDGPFSPEALQVCVSNLSTSGVGVYVPRPLKPGWEFLLSLRNMNVGMVYRVTRCEPREDGQYHVGASFVCVATAEGPMTQDDERYRDTLMAMFA